MDINNKIYQQLTDLQTLEKHRRGWIVLAIAVLLATTLIIYNWVQAGASPLQWITVSAGLLLTVAWWFWTMRVTRVLLQQKLEDRAILASVTEDLAFIRESIKILANKD